MRIQLELEEISSAGYIWETEVFGRVTVTREAIVEEPDDLAEILVGGGKVRFTLEGEGEVQFRYLRPWETEKRPQAEFVARLVA